MREIKFKAKRIDNSEWIDGFLNVIKLGGGAVQCLIIYNNGLLDTNVDPKTVCQFTGLLDHNGVEIYEGDILINDELQKGKFEVVYLLGGFEARYEDNFVLNLYQVLKHDKGEYEIIGNIHDQ